MYMHIYEDHMGGLYATDEVLSYEETYCETCGDSDTLIGSADSADEKPGHFSKTNVISTEAEDMRLTT